MDILAGGIQLLLAAEQLQGAFFPVFVFHTGVLAQLHQAVAAVFGQTHHAALVHGVARLGAVAQHAHHPAVLVRVGRGGDGQWRMLGQHPFDGLQRHPGSSPGRGVTGRDHAGVGKAGFQPGTWLAIDHADLVTRTGQIPGAGNADDPATQNQYLHCRLRLSRWCKRIAAMGDIAILGAPDWLPVLNICQIAG